MPRIWLVLLLTLSAGTVDAQTTHTAVDCSQGAVAAKVALAVDGDTVAIPPGNCTWTVQLTVTKGINLIGAGQASTTISDNVAKDGTGSSSLMVFNVSSPRTFSIGQFTLVGQAVDTFNYNKGHIALFGTSKAFRIHHITLTTPKTSFVRTDGDLWGLLDHLTINGNTSFLQCGHSNWGGRDYGDGSWAEQLYWGTAKAIYLEDSTLNATDPLFATNAFDGLDGCRAVVRYNTFHRGNTTSHGTDTGEHRRGIRSVEIYNNAYIFPAGMAVDFISWFRGGTGVFYNNAVTNTGGVNSMAKHDNQRDGASFFPWGQCNGSSVYDQNTPGQTGWLCVDQPGAGTSSLIGRSGTTPAAAPVNNIQDPIYLWGNTWNGSADNCGNVGCGNAGNVKMGRDIINNGSTPKPGYAAYTYPHPLQTGSSDTTPPAAPTGVFIF